MFKDNLVSLRKMHGFSQDELAEKIGISRQTLSKYETGESLPDIEKCKLLAEVLDVSLDDLVNYDRENSNDLGLGVPPKGKHVFGITKVGEKGQIVIPVIIPGISEPPARTLRATVPENERHIFR